MNAADNLFQLMNVYVEIHQLCTVSTEKALIGLERNDYEPDIAFWNQDKAKYFDDNTMVHPPADLIIEALSDSTKGRDRGIKFKDYAAHKVQEYWIIDSKKKTVEQYVLDNENAQEYSLVKTI
ncbi:MAG: Uma2 family endonuclease [Saprospiraceae bacterium]